MTDRELMQQALDALESCTPGDWSTGHVIHPYHDEKQIDAAIDALSDRLAQPEAEPVAYGMRNDDGQIFDCVAPDERERARYRSDYTVPLYATPQQAQPAPAATSMDYGMFIDERTNPPAQPAPAVPLISPLTLRALRLADMAIASWENGYAFDVHGPAREAQRLVTEALSAAPAVREPLTDDCVDLLFKSCINEHNGDQLWFARAIEAHHGITGDSK